MKKTDRIIADIFVFVEGRIATNVEGNVDGELNTRRTPQSLKAFHAGIECREAALGKAYDRDSRRMILGC
jgi:hypothetical protein